MMTADERRDSFAPFFYDLADALNNAESSAAAGGQASSMDPSDELLAMHEEKVQSLRDDLATRAKPLELVRQYMRLLDEAKALEESAKDTTRLTGRGVPGQKRDPGRLLREEKMRKRIKFLKPKVEEEMMRLIPAWEEESGRPFIIHGSRFLDTVELDSQQAQAAKKRIRTVSQNSVLTATPQSHASKRTNVEGSAQRSVSASVPPSGSRKVSGRTAVVQQTPTAASNGNTRNRNISGSTPSTAPTPVGPQTNGRANFRSATPSSAAPAHHQPTPSSVRQAEAGGVLRSAGVRSNTSMQPPLMPASANGKLRPPTNGLRPKQANVKRPSMLLEASLRHAPRPSSDFVKPMTTGAGTTMRALTSLVAAANDSLGPNWAILPDDEDEENLLMM
jgi:protein regulator of cytokinesis 1